MPASLAARLLVDLRDGLAALGLRWFVFGAQAVVVHGRPRLTEDVDVTVELADLPPDELVAELESRGFRLAEVADQAFVTATRVLPFTHTATGMPVDVVLAGSGLEDIFLDSAQPIDLGGVVVPVIRAEHLVVTKILAARPKDIEDVRQILVSRGANFDLAMVRFLLAELEMALGQSDLLPLFEQLIAEG